MSWYLTIRGASDYSRFTATTALVEFLSAISGKSLRIPSKQALLLIGIPQRPELRLATG